MKITLKNIKISLAHSEETILFTADVYVNNVLTAWTKNDGRGGSTWYNAHQGKNFTDTEHKRNLLIDAERYCLSLPKIKYGEGSGYREWDMNLEQFIDELIDAEIKKKEQATQKKKLVKQMETSVVFGLPNGNSYTMYGFKNKPRLVDMAKTPQGQFAIDNLIAKIKKELKEGEVIFNTNIKIN